MPNGHGGVMRYFSSVVLLLFLLALLGNYLRTGARWSLLACYAVVVLLAERFARHRYLWHVLEYGGAYVSEQEASDARFRYRFFAVVFALMGVGLVSLLWLR